MRRRTWATAAAAIAVIVAVVLAFGGGEGTTSNAQEPTVKTEKVEEGELSAMVSLDGTLTYRAQSDGSPYSAINQASGIYTDLPGVGDKVDCGDVFYRVNDKPVLLLCGAVPAYRDLAIGDEGEDVHQLNRNLHELGYDADAGVEIDPDQGEFTAVTEHALEKLQDDRGLDGTGELGIDDVVFLPGPARISKVNGQVGGSARPGAPVAEGTSDTLEVRASLEATQQDKVKEGDRAQVTLPDNKSVTGRVDGLGTVAQAPTGPNSDAGGATIPAYISLDDPKKAGGLDEAPVGINITTTGVKRALSVPVSALVGKSGGGFAVEVVREGGQHELIAVVLGLFDTAAGRVQVKGDLAEGDRVVVPSL